MIDFDSISPGTFWLGTVFPALMILVAFILIVVGLFDYRKTRELRRQPIATGVVIKSEIYETHDRKFGTHLLYRFEVNGRVYVSNKFFHGQHHLSYGRKGAEKKIAPFPVGKTVQVHYNPENPEQSIVETASLVKYYFWSALGITVGMIIWAVNFWAIELFAKT
jgi:hypothetical protein